MKCFGKGTVERCCYTYWHSRSCCCWYSSCCPFDQVLILLLLCFCPFYQVLILLLLCFFTFYDDAMLQHFDDNISDILRDIVQTLMGQLSLSRGRQVWNKLLMEWLRFWQLQYVSYTCEKSYWYCLLFFLYLLIH